MKLKFVEAQIQNAICGSHATVYLPLSLKLCAEHQFFTSTASSQRWSRDGQGKSGRQRDQGEKAEGSAKVGFVEDETAWKAKDSMDKGKTDCLPA